MLESRQVGLVLGILMLLSLTGPLFLALFVATEKVSLFVGIMGAALLGFIIFLATQNFLTIWKSSYWTSGTKKPKLVGKTLSSSLVYSIILVLIGYLIQVISGG